MGRIQSKVKKCIRPLYLDGLLPDHRVNVSKGVFTLTPNFMNTPWKRVRWTLGLLTRAARRAIKSSGDGECEKGGT